jgi:diguanylate cyclase (GGDEF)-like protein
MANIDLDKVSPGARPVGDPNAQPDIRSGLVRIIYSSVPMTLVAVLANSIALSIVQFSVVAPTTILTWLAVTNGLSVARYGLYLKFNRLPSEEPVPAYWSHLTLIISAMSGLSWGAVAIWLFPENDLVYQMFAALVIAGMCAGAVTTLAPILSYVYAFILCAMLPIILRFFQAGSDLHYAMAAMSVLFTLMLLMTSRKLNQTINESLVLRHKQVLARETIQHQAYYDSLTNLPNRRLLIGRLKQEISRSLRHSHIGAVLFLDLDHFKTINDSLGHPIGDELLKQVAQRLDQRIRDEDTAARLGGDEFIILLSEVGDTQIEAMDNVTNVADQILHLLETPFVVNSHELHISVSIGIALFPLTETSTDQLLQQSDLAMYEAKQAGRNTTRIFLPKMQKAVDTRRAIERDLRRAITEEELELFYQPQLDVDNKIIGLEALLRWNHPTKGITAPDEFIEVAENTGLISQIGDWVLFTACRDLSALAANSETKMCINVSPRQFAEVAFVDKLKSIIAASAVKPENIQLEITEGMLIRDIESAIEKMHKLKSFGVSFSIDDFGTGYSSLAYLKRLPVDILKIDKSFVIDINKDENDAVIVETVIAMAKHMQIDVVAEGVENEETQRYLESKGCTKFQGYLYARPMPLKQLFHHFPELSPPNQNVNALDIRSSQPG